jgi:DNA-binding MarR family transcriptional regulator
MTAPILTGQDIAETAGAVQGLLEAVVAASAAGTEVTADEGVILRVLTLRPAMTSEQAAQFLGAQRQLRRTPEEFAGVLRSLAERGLVTGLAGDGPVTTTERGAEVFATLSAALQPVTERLYSGLDPAGLGQAKQTLAQVTERAHALRRELVG